MIPTLKLPYAVVKFTRPRLALEQDVLGRFKVLGDAVWYAKNVHRANTTEILSIRVYDTDSMKEHAKFNSTTPLTT